MKSTVLFFILIICSSSLAAQDFERCKCFSNQSVTQINFSDTVYTTCFADALAQSDMSFTCSILDSLALELVSLDHAVLNIYAIANLVQDSAYKVSVSDPDWFIRYYKRALFVQSYLKRKQVSNAMNCFCIRWDSISNHKRVKLNYRYTDCSRIAYIQITDPLVDTTCNWIIPDREIDTRGRLFLSSEYKPDTRSFLFFSQVLNALLKNEKSEVIFHCYTPIAATDFTNADQITATCNGIVSYFAWDGFSDDRVKYVIHWSQKPSSNPLDKSIERISIEFEGL